MSKKARRSRRPAPLQDTRPIIHPHLATQALIHANQLLQKGDFQAAIHVCEHLLAVIPKGTPHQIEALALLGLAHGMLEHFAEGYAVFNEAITIDPRNPELWYNHSIACSFTERTGQALRSIERAIELLHASKNELLGPHKGALGQKFSKELEACRKAAQKSLEIYGPDFTLDQLIDQEEHFQVGLSMLEAKKWAAAERAFRHIIASGYALAAHWGNLGVSLTMLQRYDEAEAAFKRSLELEPDDEMTLDNLAALPRIRQTNRTHDIGIYYSSEEPPSGQKMTLYNRGDGSSRGDTTTTIEKVGNGLKITATQSETPGKAKGGSIKTPASGQNSQALTSPKTGEQIGKQPPRHSFFLNPYKDVRFTTCPQCGYATRTRKFALLIRVEPGVPIVMDKIFRFCYHCDMIIAHQDQVEERLEDYFTGYNPKYIGNDYHVLGTLDRSDWTRGKAEAPLIHETLEHLHDFKAVLKFEPVGAWVRKE